MFARQPARVQASWLGYLHSTGLSRIQYRITDAFADPAPDAERLHTEALLRLPHSQWCYRPLAAVDASPRRAGDFTFGSFNQIAKLSAATRRLWIQLLRDAPRARLALTGIPEGPARATLLAEFAADGIAADRLDIAPHISVAEYFARISAVDVALDPTPYSGGTTTLDALWMGVPVVTLAGERSVSRSAASVLRTLGLQDWIARTPQEYVAIALRAARAPEALAALRASLRPRLRASPLMDEPRFARDFEAMLRGVARA